MVIGFMVFGVILWNRDLWMIELLYLVDVVVMLMVLRLGIVWINCILVVLLLVCVEGMFGIVIVVG